MVLLNIDTLSDSEIRYIAQQEDIEDWDTLSREDLIDCLKELYSDTEAPTDLTRSRDHKYFNTLASAQSDVSSLPGVSPVSDHYNETYFHVVDRDANWVYAFWEINENIMEEILQNHDSLVIKVSADATKTEAEQSYEININVNDTNWNIELPWFGRTYSFTLIRRSASQDIVLCKSSKHYIQKYFFAEHPEELKNPNTYHILVSSMVSKDGHILNCQQVKEIVENA